jgi:hypothetical protein
MTLEGLTRKIQKATTFDTQLTSAAQRLGYDNISIYIVCYKVLIKANCIIPYLAYA